MIDTLWHMADHDLEIHVERVDKATADAEEQRLATAATPPVVWVADDFRRPH